uniref:Uncharacterized protein n=1 Tax=Ditylenchus dipsaci TaxID=166011 RepID=A0A915DC22_9BILA
MCPEESTYEQRDKMISSIIDYYFEKHQPNLNVPVEISQQFRSKYDSMIDIQAKFRRPKFTGEKYTVLESGDPMGLSEEEYDEVVKNYSADLLQDQVTEKLGHMNHLSSFEKLLKIQGLGKQARPMGKEVRRMMTQQLIDSFSQQDRDNIYADNRFNNLGAPLKETLRQSQACFSYKISHTTSFIAPVTFS